MENPGCAKYAATHWWNKFMGDWCGRNVGIKTLVIGGVNPDWPVTAPKVLKERSPVLLVSYAEHAEIFQLHKSDIIGCVLQDNP